MNYMLSVCNIKYIYYMLSVSNIKCELQAQIEDYTLTYEPEDQMEWTLENHFFIIQGYK
jgi:hypothetical protein